MKKFLLIVLSLLTVELFSQVSAPSNLTQLAIPELVTFGNPIYYTFYTFDADDEDDSFYVYCERNHKSYYYGQVILDFNKYLNPGVLYKVSKNLESYSFNNINVPNYYSFICCTDNKESIIAFYKDYDKADDILSIKKVVFNKNNIKAEPRIENVLNFHIGNKDYSTFTSAKSPDKQFFAITMLLTDKQNNLKDLFTATFNNEGDLLWQTTSTPSLENNFFNIADMQVSNAGIVYYCISSYSKVDHKIFDNKVHLYSVENNSTDIQYEDIDFGSIKDMKMKFLKNGKIFIGGYYSEKPQGNAIGSFSFTFDPVSLAILNNDYQPFNSDYKESIVSNTIDERLINQQIRISCDHIFELDNGKIIMLGEQRADFATSSSFGTKYTCYAKYILTNTFTPKGDCDKYYMIQKNQCGSTSLYYSNPQEVFVSYSAFNNENNVYLIYNDLTNNLSKKTSGAEIFKIKNPLHRINKNSCVTLIMIDKNDDVSKLNIMDCPTVKKVFNQIMYINGNDIVFDAYSRKSNSLSKFTLPN